MGPMRDLILEKLVRAIGRLSTTAAGGLGALLGRFAYRLSGRSVRNARVNLALCFPGEPESTREQMVRTNLIESGRTLAHMIKIWTGDRADWSGHFDDNGFIEAGRERVARGRGLIVALPHLGNWELIAYSLRQIAPTTALYRPPRLGFMDAIMHQGRARSGITPVPIDRGGLKALYTALQRGECIVILPDQVPKASGAAGVIAPFFNHPAMTMTLIGRLARRSGAATLFCYAVPDERGRYGAHWFDAEPGIADASAEKAAAALNRDVERCVRECPAFYQWTYRRFEIPGQRASSPYSRHKPA